MKDLHQGVLEEFAERAHDDCVHWSSEGLTLHANSEVDRASANERQRRYHAKHKPKQLSGAQNRKRKAAKANE